MNKEETLKILETSILLSDGMNESEILTKLSLGPYLEKAKEILEILKK